MADQAHEWTDNQIERLNRRLAREYSQAAMEMRTKLNGFLEDYEYANQSWKDAVRSGEATRKDYRDWLASQASKRRYVVDMTNKLADDALNVDQRAFEIINETIPQVYAENANYAAYSIENGIGRDTGGFALYDQDTVRRLMTMDENDQVIHEVIPIGPPNTPLQSLRVNLNTAKDVRWNRQKFTSAITQSILQGESIPNTAKRLAGVLNMDRGMATRAARTAMTSAENAGRVDSYQRAERMGITLEQEWMATLDERTRNSHRLMDGEHVKVGQKFSNGLEFPGDPSGPGDEIWNCRCTLVAWLPGIEQEDNKRWSRLPEGMTYEQWKDAKKAQENAGIPFDGNPKTLAGVTRGRPMTFDEANESRGNPYYSISNSPEYKEWQKSLDEARREQDRLYENMFLTGQLDEGKLASLENTIRESQNALNELARQEVGYHTNCQTCVVAYEARRRGYDVQATPNTKGSINSVVAHQTNMPWIDPKTGRHPDYIIYDGDGDKDMLGHSIPTYESYVDWLERDGTIEERARYTISFVWQGGNDGYGYSGHIVNLERTPNGLRLYDPQCGKSYDAKGTREYLKNVRYVSDSGLGLVTAEGPKLLKVSDYDFDVDVCNRLLTEAI